MKKILIIVVLSLTFTSCMTVSESRRQYIGKTYVAEMGTGKVYIEFASDKDCQIRPSEDYMGMFTYPCIYGSIMKKVDTKEIMSKVVLRRFMLKWRKIYLKNFKIFSLQYSIFQYKLFTKNIKIN